MGAAKAVTDTTFAQEVLKSPTPVVVDFWAEWCIQCPKLETVLAELATTDLASKVKFVKVDIDVNPQVTQCYRVMSVPTITIFKSGEPVGSVTGLRPKRELIRLIESAL
ncbi:MAG: thioredoxin fold domain-containing protein [Micromonosporaceae bacterium]|nr:thioredoxin fold domain-containing protein [Micromonosporaceae bacterium]